MAVSDFPSIEPTSVEMRLQQPIQLNRAMSGRETRNLITGSYYELTYNFSNLTEAQRRQITAHIALARGSLEAFYVKLPTYLDDANGSASGTITVRTNAAAGVTSVDYSKVGAGNVLVFKAGDLIQFSNHGKLYEVTADSTSVGTDGSVSFIPPLRTAVTTAHTINYSNIEMLVRYGNEFGWSVGNNSYADITLDFIEVFE